MTVTIELTPELEARIDALATKWGREKSALLQDIIANGLSDTEVYYEAADIRDRIERGEEVTVTDAELRAELGLDD